MECMHLFFGLDMRKSLLAVVVECTVMLYCSWRYASILAQFSSPLVSF